MEGQWRIRDRLTAQIWDDPWILDFKNLTVPNYLKVEGVENLTFSSLINNDTNTWFESMVRSTFNPLVAAAILRINPRPGKWMWAEDKQGKFSIKNAYKAIQTSKQGSQGDCLT